jgi:hypothetical protein
MYRGVLTMVEIWVAIITGVLSLCGVIITVCYGNKQTAKKIKASSDLTLYRLEQVEKKQDKHNNLIERVYLLEKHEAVVDEEIKVANHRIEDLELYHKPQ